MTEIFAADEGEERDEFELDKTREFCAESMLLTVLYMMAELGEEGLLLAFELHVGLKLLKELLGVRKDLVERYEKQGTARSMELGTQDFAEDFLEFLVLDPKICTRHLHK